MNSVNGVKKRKRAAQEEESTQIHGDPKRTARKGEELIEEMDTLVEEMDAVLEENAEAFVKNYVQRGGE